MSVETDSNGRLYLPAELRQQYGEKFHVVTYEDRIELIPIADDPLQAVREEPRGSVTRMERSRLRPQSAAILCAAYSTPRSSISATVASRSAWGHPNGVALSGSPVSKNCSGR